MGSDPMSDDESFLGRWSRRKVQARSQPAALSAEDGVQQAPAPSDAATDIEVAGQSVEVTSAAEASEAEASDAKAGSESQAKALPSLDSLHGLDSEYGDFLKPEVGEDTRRAALKKLFADPHFNEMDGLDVYIDDYGKFEPMPAAVASSLAAFHRLSVFDHLASEQAKRGDPADAETDRSTPSGAAAERVAIDQAAGASVREAADAASIRVPDSTNQAAGADRRADGAPVDDTPGDGAPDATASRPV